MAFFADKKKAERSNAKNGGFADAKEAKKTNKNNTNISGARKKTCILDFGEKKRRN